MNKFYVKAVAMCEQHKFLEAIELFNKVPSSAMTQFNIATCHKDIGTLDHLLISKKLFEEMLFAKQKKFKSNRSSYVYDDAKVNYISVITLLVNYYANNAMHLTAIDLLNEAISKYNDANLLYNLGHLYKCVGNFDTAIKYLLMSLEKDDKHLDTYVELINIYRDRSEYETQLKYITDGIKNVPNSASLYNDLGLYYTKRNSADAISAFTKALELGSNNPKLLAKIHTNIGHLHSIEGNVDKGIEHYLLASKIFPDDAVPKQNYAMDLLYLSNIDYKTVIKTHLETGCTIKKINYIPNIKRSGSKNEKIHVGYVSGDFFDTHPMTYFVRQFLTNYSHDKFQIYCYNISNAGDISVYSANIRWRNIKYMTVMGCCNQIISDNIDILIDLSGHTSGNRMDIFANRLAPLQLSYLGYPCITGMPDIDYYIIDKTFNFNFKTLALPHCFTHYEIPFVPQNLNQPCHNNNYITFCSFNKASKINASVVALWDKVLDAYPASILFIKKIDGYNFRNADRVKLVGTAVRYEDYVGQYNAVDIALDTFPYAGTTTTCEALLMGTPVVTLADRKNNAVHQNTTASLLINSDLAFLVATNDEEYISIVGKIISNIKQCKNYKDIIQRKFLNGSVTNAKQYLQDYENMLETKFNEVAKNKIQ